MRLVYLKNTRMKLSVPGGSSGLLSGFSRKQFRLGTFTARRAGFFHQSPWFQADSPLPRPFKYSWCIYAYGYFLFFGSPANTWPASSIPYERETPAITSSHCIRYIRFIRSSASAARNLQSSATANINARGRRARRPWARDGGRGRDGKGN